MAEQTIIVMSDSHGERDIVVDIKNRYQGKVDAIFHNGDSELESSDPVWEGIHVVRVTVIMIQVIQNVWSLNLVM